MKPWKLLWSRASCWWRGQSWWVTILYVLSLAILWVVFLRANHGLKISYQESLERADLEIQQTEQEVGYWKSSSRDHKQISQKLEEIVSLLEEQSCRLKDDIEFWKEGKDFWEAEIRKAELDSQAWEAMAIYYHARLKSCEAALTFAVEGIKDLGEEIERKRMAAKLAIEAAELLQKNVAEQKAEIAKLKEELKKAKEGK